MFATAILWARKLGPRPVKLANLGEQVEAASQTLYKVIEQNGPISLSDCWNHASQVIDHFVTLTNFVSASRGFLYLAHWRSTPSECNRVFMFSRWRITG